ncbi:MAG TPA: hypothetical protein VEV44_14390 [Pseudoneobacillus sp.]|nr:hypothetical protein [Pseudoneobacillus sp.]
MTKYLGLHETLEVHELLTFKNLCVTKSQTMSAFVQDEALKNLLANDAQAGSQHITQLQQFLTKRGDLA